MSTELSQQTIHMRNVVFITNLATNYDTVDYSQYCLATWQHWCKRHDVELIVLDQPLVDPAEMKATWQRWYVLDILETNSIEYDQVALVDIDTMIHWDAPNFFNETKHNLAACVDNDNVGWVWQSLKGYQHLFPQVKLDWVSYYNCGFVVINKQHRELCTAITDFWHTNAKILTELQTTLRKGTDQTPVNYLTRQLDYDVTLLNKRWNLTHLNRKELLSSYMFVECGYVWHFNGFDKQHRVAFMQQTWETFKDKYAN